MANLQNEVRQAVHYMLESLKPMMEKGPDALIRGAFEDFNSLLARAKEAYPGSRTIKDMKPLQGSTNLVELVAKLGVIQGAVIAETHP